MIKKIKLGLAVGVVSLVLTGCGTSYSTVVSPASKNISDRILITMDQSSSAMPFQYGKIARENLKYALGSSAQISKDSGYKYFKIDGPSQMIDLLQEKNVKTIDDIYNACNQGEDSFAYSLTYREVAIDLGSTNINRCDSITRRYDDIGIAVYSHNVVSFVIKMTNEYIENETLINADEALKSDLLKGLNADYFKTIYR